MKKSFLLSFGIHITLLSILIFAINFIPEDKKVEPVKIKILIPSVQTSSVKSQAVTQPTSQPTPQKNVQQIKTTPMLPVQPSPSAVQTMPKALPSTIIPVQPAAPIQPAKIVQPIVPKNVEVPAAKPTPKPAAVEVVKTDPKVKENYIAYLRQYIDEHKIYPKNAKRLKQTGIVTVKFRVMEDGTLKNVSVIDSSGFDLLDQAARELLENISHVRAIPKEMGNDSIDVTLPIEYTMR